MKKLALVLFLLLALQSWGVYGAWQTQRILYRCTVEVGPLCYAWEETALVKAVGRDNAEKLEGKLKAAKQAFEEGFLDRLTREKSGFEEALEKAGDAAKEGLRSAQEAAEGALERD